MSSIELAFFPILKVTAHSTAQGSGRLAIPSLIKQHFANQEPFIYVQPADLFASLWDTPSPLTIHTQDSEAQKEKLTRNGTIMYEDLWKAILTHILVCFLGGTLPFPKLKESIGMIYNIRSLDLEFHKLLRPVVEAWPHRGAALSDAVRHWFVELLHKEVSAILNLPSSWGHAQMLTLPSGQSVRFTSICVLRARFASQVALEEMEVHGHHMPGPPCKTSSLRTHGRFAPVHRKEILTMIEQSEQDIYLYDPTLQAGTDSSVPKFKFCTPQVLTTACGLYENFSQPFIKDSIISKALERHNISLQIQEGHNIFPIMSVALPTVIVSFLIQFS